MASRPSRRNVAHNKAIKEDARGSGLTACGTFSPDRIWRPAVVARLAQTIRASQSLSNRIQSWLNRAAIDHETGLHFYPISLVLRVVAFWMQGMWTAKLQTVIGASLILRTLMKDARRGLHSLVETQSCLGSVAHLGRGRTFHSLGFKVHHVPISTIVTVRKSSSTDGLSIKKVLCGAGLFSSAARL